MRLVNLFYVSCVLLPLSLYARFNDFGELSKGLCGGELK